MSNKDMLLDMLYKNLRFYIPDGSFRNVDGLGDCGPHSVILLLLIPVLHAKVRLLGPVHGQEMLVRREVAEHVGVQPLVDAHASQHAAELTTLRSPRAPCNENSGGGVGGEERARAGKMEGGRRSTLGRQRG